MIPFSFNDPVGRFNYTWQGFTLDYWANPFAIPGLRESLSSRLQIAALAAVAATILGTLIALALVRYGFRGRGATNLLIFLPMTTPEVVLGASLLALFLNLGVATGIWTIFIAHVMFCISFVVVTVKARIIGFDRHLEEAAMDLGANEWTTFRKVTLPIIAPGIVAGRADRVRALRRRLRDHELQRRGRGDVPALRLGAARVGVPPQVNVIGTMIFLFAVTADADRTCWPSAPRGEERR